MNDGIFKYTLLLQDKKTKMGFHVEECAQLYQSVLGGDIVDNEVPKKEVDLSSFIGEDVSLQ